MALDNENFNKDLYNLLKVRKYKPIPLDSKNQRVPTPQTAAVFQFEFNKDDKSYGNVWVSLDENNALLVYYDEEQQNSPNSPTPGVDYDDTWTGLLRHLKQWAQRRQMSFELLNKDRLDDDMKQREYYKMKSQIHEAYHKVNKNTSYNDGIPKVKLILQHSKNLSETDQRFRHIKKIFIENEEGERLLAPTNKPGIAKIYARHIAEGGLTNDQRWSHIKELTENFKKLSTFNRAVKNKSFDELANDIVNEGINKYTSLKETLYSLRSSRGYNQYFGDWKPELVEDNTEDYSSYFKSLDPRIEEALPIITKGYKKLKEVKELETWANNTSTPGDKAVKKEYKKKQLADYETSRDDPFNVKREKKYELKEDKMPDQVLRLLQDYIFIFEETTTEDYASDMDHRSVVDGDLHYIEQELSSYGYEVHPNIDYECMIIIHNGEKTTVPFDKLQNGILSESKLPSNQLGPTEKAKKISPVLGKPQKKHPFDGKLVGGC